MPSFQKKITWCEKKQENRVYPQEKKQSTKNCPEEDQTLDLLDEDFEEVILILFKQVKKTA